MDERKIGFIQGLIYSAALIKEYELDGDCLIKESGISIEDLKKYGEETDLEKLDLN